MLRLITMGALAAALLNGCSAINADDLFSGRGDAGTHADARVDVGSTPGGPSGVAKYRKHVLSADGGVSLEWRPVAGCAVELVDKATDQVLESTTTDPNGRFAFSKVGSSHLRVRLLAQAEGARLHVRVTGTSPPQTPWAVVQGGPPWDIAISEAYAVGAFNVVQLARVVASGLEGVVATESPPPLTVRWSDALSPACGSCFFADTDQLDLTGYPDDEDAHDDAVVLHELGHWVESTYGYYSNPGGLHDLNPVTPTLAWSEGFATFFSAALRADPIYFDVQPGQVYTLDLESPPAEALGTSDGSPAGDLSEALVYAVLWDLLDTQDAQEPQDEAAQFPRGDIFETCLGLLDRQDLGATGADLRDFLNDWRCAHASADSVLQTVLDLAKWPLEAQEPLCL